MASSRAPSAEDPRRRILDAAAVTFAAHGFRGGSLNDIAVAAGFTRPGVLHHFPTKEAVLLALLEQRDRELDVLVPPVEDISLLALLERLDTVSRRVLDDRRLVQLAHIMTAEASGADHPAHDWVAARQARFRQILARAAATSKDRGELPADVDENVVATLVFAVVEGYENQWLMDPGGVDMDEVQTLLQRMLRALGSG